MMDLIDVFPEPDLPMSSTFFLDVENVIVQSPSQNQGQGAMQRSPVVHVYTPVERRWVL